MNCQEFEKVSGDLTRNLPIEAAARDRALAHAQGCARCTRQLDEARLLLNGLRALAIKDAALRASDRVEADLLVAFRESAKAPVVPPAAFTTMRQPRPFISRLVKGALATAAALLLITLVALALRNAQQEEQTVKQAPIENQQQIVNSPQDQEKGAQPVPQREGEKLVRQFKRAPHRATSVGLQANRRTRDQAVNNREISTNFIPLMSTDDLLQLNSGQLVRVKMPRSALLSFGLPVNMERASEPITADLLIGQDGLARAIRFVQ